MADKLIEIESENWSELRDLYAVDDPNTYFSHCTIENYIQWLEKEPTKKDWFIYSLNGDWSDGTYLMLNREYAYVSTLAKTGEHLIRLIQLLDFSKRYKFVCVLKRDYPAIVEALRRKNIETDTDVDYLLYHLPREEALHFEPNPPEGITLKTLRECDADIMDSERPDLRNESVDYLRRIIRLNPTVGAYTEDGKLIAWFHRSVDGQAAGLHVLKEYYGRGLGKTVAKHLLRKIAESGYMNVITILEANKYSRNIFEPMGFRLIGKTGRIYTVPKTKDADS